MVIGNGKQHRWDFAGGISMNPLESRYMRYYGQTHDSRNEGVLLHDDGLKESIMIWDRGQIEIIEPSRGSSSELGIKSGYLKFQIFGEKVKGSFNLKVHNIGTDKWNLTKERDRFAAMGNHTFSQYSVDSELSLKDISRKAESSKVFLTPVKVIDESKKGNADNYLKDGQISTRRKVFDTLFGKLPLGFKLFNLENIIYPEVNVLKKDVLIYYLLVGKKILPFIKDHPIHLRRYSNGIDKNPIIDTSFIQTKPKWVSSLPIYGEDNETVKELILCQDIKTLLYLQNYNIIESPYWSGSLNSMSSPMFYVIKVRPNKTSLKEYRNSLLLMKEVLDSLNLKSFIKTSGIGWQMDIFIPFKGKYKFSEYNEFREKFKSLLEKKLTVNVLFDETSDDPLEKYIGISTKANFKKAVLYPPYGLRTSTTAQVSVPITWEEVLTVRPQNYTIDTITEEFVKNNDAWEGIWDVDNSIKDSAAA